MKLFWKVFCSMVSITSLTCSIGGFVLIDGQFQVAVDREIQSLYEENDMLRFALARELDRHVVVQRQELSRLADQITLTTGGRTVDFRLTDPDGTILGGSGFLAVDAMPLVFRLAENQRGWRLQRGADGYALLHGASTLSLLGETMYLENCRDITALFVQRESQYQCFSCVMLALIAGVAVLSLLVSHLILRPLNNLSQAARSIAAGELARRVPISTEDELGQLSEDFNSMAAQLETHVARLTDAARREQDFTASFAHEIKTPLTSIIGYADLLLSRACSSAQIQECAGYIFREGRRLEALSRKLMDLIVLDRQNFQLRPVPLKEFLERVGDTLCLIMEQSGICLNVDAEDTLVSLEATLMETVCLNLLDNARKATPPGGRVTLTGLSVGDGRAAIRVADTGKGIPENELAKITEPFYMVDKSRARAQGSAGLGLALCQRIVALYGGSMEFESTVGQGTVVTVWLNGGNAQ